MRQILIFLLGSFAAMGLTGCLKDTPNVDFSLIKPVVEINGANFTSVPNTPPAGIENFDNATLIFAIIDSTVTFTVNYASVNPPTSDVQVTVGINDAARTAYNASNNGQYLAFPVNSYTLVSTKATIKAGTRLATFTVKFMPSLIDPTVSYMLPITITDASGNIISGNFSTIYLHQIGNPLAGGIYTQEWIRYNNADGSGTPKYDLINPNGAPAVFIPISGTDIRVTSGTGVNYILSFTNTNGVLSNFSVALDKKSVDKAGITIASGPVVLLADPVNHKFTFQFNYLNSSGLPRYIVDKFY